MHHTYSCLSLLQTALAGSTPRLRTHQPPGWLTGGKKEARASVSNGQFLLPFVSVKRSVHAAASVVGRQAPNKRRTLLAARGDSRQRRGDRERAVGGGETNERGQTDESKYSNQKKRPIATVWLATWSGFETMEQGVGLQNGSKLKE